MQTKDVIYIDIEDDITAIIGKVKAAKNKVVALVPPKRAGVLQSAVNLKLLQKAAKTNQKHVVLITNDRLLITLAAGVKMPVAKNLQSRPEIPAMEAPENEAEEVIDGQSISVGDFAGALGAKAAVDKGESQEDVEQKSEVGGAALAAAKKESAVTKAVDKVKSRIPNFNSFRKKVFLVGGGVVLLAGLLVWAIAFAPSATVTITAKTSPVNISKKLTLDATRQQSDTGRFELKATVQQVKKSVATEFDATGSKDIGSKAKGTITVRNCDYPDDFTLPAGAKFTSSSGKVFITTKAVVVPQFKGPAPSCTQSGSASGKADVTVEAQESGPSYNIAAQKYTLSGYTSGVDGFGTEMEGGTSQIVKVVSQEDVDKAKELLPQTDAEAAESELKALFTDSQIIIEESFEVKIGDVVASPAVGEQANRAKITRETTYTISGLDRSDVDTILKAAVGDQLVAKPDQQAYSYGEDTIRFQDFQRTDANITTVSLVTTGFVGPKIDVDQLAEQLTGKRYGEIQAHVNNIPGVQSVTIDLSPFWVSRAPAADKIDIKFTVANGS